MASSSRTVVTYLKYGHLVLDKRLGSPPRNSVDRLTARLAMTLLVLTGPQILKTKQNKKVFAIIDYGITLSYDCLSQKIIKNMPSKG